MREPAGDPHPTAGEMYTYPFASLSPRAAKILKRSEEPSNLSEEEKEACGMRGLIRLTSGFHNRWTLRC